MLKSSSLSSPRAPHFSPRPRAPCDITSPPPSPSAKKDGPASPRTADVRQPRAEPTVRRPSGRLAFARSALTFAREDEGAANRFPLLDLPPEVIGVVLSALDARSLARVQATCTTLREAASREDVWKMHFQASWRWRPPWWALSGVVEATETPSEGWLRAYQERAAASRPASLTCLAPGDAEADASVAISGSPCKARPPENNARRGKHANSRAHRAQLCAPTVLTASAGSGGAARKLLTLSRRGDTVELEPGVHQGPLVVPPGVALRARLGSATVVSDDAPALAFHGDSADESDVPTIATGLTLWRRCGGATSTNPAVDAAVHVTGGVLLLDSCSIVSAGKGVVAEPGAVVYLNTCDVSSVDAGVVASTGELRGCNITGAAADVSTSAPPNVAANPIEAAPAATENPPPQTQASQQLGVETPPPRAAGANAEEVNDAEPAPLPDEAVAGTPSVYALVTIVGGAVGIINCRVLGGAAHGVAVLDDGCGPIARNLIAQNSGCGLCIGLRGNPVASDNLVADNGGCGVSVYARGLGCLLHCEIRGNGEAGVDVSGGSDAENFAQPVHDDADDAPAPPTDPLMDEAAPASSEDDADAPQGGNDGGESLDAEEAPAPTTTFHIEGCLIHRNGGHGLMATAGASVRSSDCDICSNGMNGALICTGSQASLSRARVLSNAYHGVEVEDALTRLELVSCRVAHSRMSNLFCAGLAHARLHASDLSHSECGHGVEVEGGASVALTGCALRGNGACGLFAAASTPTLDLRSGEPLPDASTVSLRWCSLTDNAMHGSEVYEGSAAPGAPSVLCELTECRLARNLCAEIAMGGEATASGSNAAADGTATLPLRRRSAVASHLKWSGCLFGGAAEDVDQEVEAREDDWERAAMSDHSLPPLAARAQAQGSVVSTEAAG